MRNISGNCIRHQPDRMITEQYIKAYKDFVKIELSLTSQYNGQEYVKRLAPYYQDMYNHISQNPEDYIIFNHYCNVTYYEMEFVEAVEPIREKLFDLAKQYGIPIQILFIPRVKIDEDFWGSIINLNVIKIVRQLFDEATGEEFETLRLFKAFDRNSLINKWVNSKSGKNFLFEFQVSQGIKSEFLIKKRLYLFDKEFVRQQMLRMSEKIWIHKEVIAAFGKWENDKTLWNKIDHIKRKIALKEILDESRQEIRFLRMLENAGLKGHFIHDEHISWQLKYRPDYWFVNESLIVEYDETAHKFRVEEDFQREKIIKKHLPNIHFVRVTEGAEDEGLKKILSFLAKFSS
jgi:very-short-patch-repair endonuclease